jgi:glutamyl-tRNA synthetase/glutamyl-Q tRNA(Asp) synthetase
MTDRCRYAPTPSGPAHPGTLLAGLLAWLDARSRGAPLLLRLEDVDPLRCTPEHAAEMRSALRWLGLDWDTEQVQSERRGEHEAALDRLEAEGRLYPCSCSRAEVRRAGQRAADGGFRYPGSCRPRPLPPGGWRASSEALRLRLEPGRIELVDEGGLDLSQDPEAAMGDPVVRRRDGALAYHLAVVADDAADGISRVVRGRDLASSTAIHVALQRALGLPTPTYRHHFLLLEEHGGKLAKLHGAVGWRELRGAASAGETCGLLARLAGLHPGGEPTTPAALLEVFDWERVEPVDQVLRWTGRELERLGPAPGRSAD